MNTILIKIFATALAFSQVTTKPDAVKTHFDAATDQAEVVQLLRDGCAHMRKAFDVEDINLDDLITTAMDDPQAIAGDVKAFHGLDFKDLYAAYRQFCKNEKADTPVVDIGEVIDYYDKAVADLPDHSKLKDMKLPGVSLVLDGKDERYTEIFQPDHRRITVPLSDIPETVQKAFVAAEDKRFFEHKGVDERGLIRAFIGNLAQPGRPQGGSTITQQVAKNLLVGDDVTYDRKMREMIEASRLERSLSKQEILALYLNSIYLGRGAWGIEMAARSYFGKSAKDLTLSEGALLAGLPKGPSYFSPDRNPERAQERRAYVLSRMQEDGVITPEQMKQTVAETPRLVVYDRPRRDSGFYYVDQLSREAKSVASIDSLTAGSYTIHSTVDPALQRATEAALQDGLARYELMTGRVDFHGAEANLAEAVRKLGEPKAGAAPPDPPVSASPPPPQRASGKSAQKASAPPPDPKLSATPPLWQQALTAARLPLYDVHWTPAIVLDKTGKSGDAMRVGLADGRVLPLTTYTAAARRNLKPYDVVYVRVPEGKKAAARAELRVRPTVQGAAIILENKTGRILATAGGFSYPQSQLNRATQAQRQPGSTLKPLTYLAALQKGLQPNTLVQDAPITFPPLNGGLRDRDYWTPKNFDGGGSGVSTLRRALEHSKNLVTARLLDGGIESDPEQSLDRVCELAMEAQLYAECVHYYPFVLGAQPVRLVDLAAFYAAIANEGARPAPHVIEEIDQNGQPVYKRAAKPLVQFGSADRVAFYQLKTMLQGVVTRGTAASLAALAPYIAGKTGTSDNENDAWFAGFTNDITVVVWVGYDNADGKRRTLGNGNTGAKVAIPIFQSIIQAAWANGIPKVALNGPSPEARSHIASLPIDLNSGDRLPPGTRGFMETFRLGDRGDLDETQYRLVTREDAYAMRGGDTGYPSDDGDQAYYGRPSDDGRVYGRPSDADGFFGQQPPWRSDNPQTYWREAPRGQYPAQPQQRGLFTNPPWWDNNDSRERTSRRRVDPDYFWQRPDNF